MRLFGKTTRKLIGAAIALIFAATAFKAVMNQFVDGPNDVFPSSSADEAKARGIFVSGVTIHPQTFALHDHPVEFATAWIERDSRGRHRLVWFRYEERRPGFRFCFVLSRGTELFFPHGSGVWRNDAGDGGFNVRPAMGMFFQRLKSLREPIQLTASSGTATQIVQIELEQQESE